MATHDNHDALVDYDAHSVSSREKEDRPVTIVNKSPTPSGTNEGGEGNDATLCQENSVHESDRADANMPMGDRVDLFMTMLVARAYATAGRKYYSSSAVEEGEFE